ncbi:MAG: glycosyltransferase [Devosia sp.]|uniref:glycosyltransferase n=1 Tax=Devosia sp. TaxID=1871048 RepID=UPI0024CDF8D1|nr:glycosyltransferase [Devosia sp.]UYO01224.1 MAG: glycosyltransferase [Devosia sp.]
MTVAFLLNRLNLGGAENHTLGLGDRLEAEGRLVQTMVLLTGGADPHPAVLPGKQLDRIGGRSILDLSALRELGHRLRSERVDLVLAVNQTALTAAMVTRWLGWHEARVVCVFHTTMVTSLGGRLKLPIFKFLASRSDGIIYVSRNQQRYWTERGLSAPRVTAITNGIDTRRFRPPTAPERSAARAALGFTPEDVVIILSGRFAPEKNHVQLIEAVHRLGAAGERFKLLLIGEGDTEPMIRQQVSAHGLDDRVYFAGARVDIPQLLHAGDIGVLVSNAVETFSLAALEAMASGLPVVLSDIGGATEMVIHGENGYLFPVNDTQSLTECLLALADENLRQRMGAAARARVEKEHTIETMLDRYRAFIDGRPAVDVERPESELIP